jgi:hypothetical protein
LNPSALKKRTPQPNRRREQAIEFYRLANCQRTNQTHRSVTFQVAIRRRFPSLSADSISDQFTVGFGTVCSEFDSDNIEYIAAIIYVNGNLSLM